MGKRKAKTFATLAAFAGKRDVELPAPPTARATAKIERPKKKVAANGDKGSQKKSSTVTSVGAIDMAVRVEINLPATTDQDVYRAIFKSLREDLLNG